MKAQHVTDYTEGKTDCQCHCFGVPQVIITKLCPENPKKLARLLLGRGNCQTHTALSPAYSDHHCRNPVIQWHILLAFQRCCIQDSLA